ncbi:hypothetical protein [Zymomonas mobilis]|uniref:hypothetical protein n=1 Tax=Zymomonas mobilis TaxID=542 RepID=UPI0039E85149
MAANNIITIISSIATLSVSITIAIFSYQLSKAQKNIAKEKLKLDLFDRRYKIYNIFKNRRRLLNSELDTDKKNKIMSEINDSVQESFFLFDKDVHDKLYDIFRIFGNLDTEQNTYKGYQQSRSMSGDKDQLKDEIKQSATRMQNFRAEIDEFYVQIDEIFAKYMSFEDLKIK